jgi:hypothetical protein
MLCLVPLRERKNRGGSKRIIIRYELDTGREVDGVVRSVLGRSVEKLGFRC